MPGLPPLSPWVASQGLPGGGPGPMSAAQNMASPLGFRINFYVDFDHDFWLSWVDLGSLRRSCWDHFFVFSAQVGPGTVFESSYLRKNEFSPDSMFPTLVSDFSPKMAPPNDPRSLQDGSKIVLDRFFASCFFASIFDRLGIDFGAVLGSKMEPQGCR